MIYFLFHQVIFKFIPFPKALSESPELEWPLWLSQILGPSPWEKWSPAPTSCKGLPTEKKKLKFPSGLFVCLNSTTKSRQPNTNLLTVIFRWFHFPLDVVSISKEMWLLPFSNWHQSVTKSCSFSILNISGHNPLLTITSAPH